MIDKGLITKKLSLVEQYCAELDSAQPERLDSDLRERRFVEHTLQIAIQACQDVAARIVSEGRLGDPRTNQELFDLLTHANWIDAALARKLRAAVGFRNVLVHGYASVDLKTVRAVLVDHRSDLLEFAAAIRSRLDST